MSNFWIQQIPVIRHLQNHIVFGYANKFFPLDPFTILFIVPRRSVYSFGRNFGHRLGLGHPNDVFTFPEEIQQLRNYQINSIASATNFCFVLTSCKKIFAWGGDSAGRVIYPVPTWIQCPGEPEKIACSFSFRMILQKDGLTLIHTLNGESLCEPFHDCIDIACTGDRYVVLTKELSIWSNRYSPDINFQPIHYRIESWIHPQRLICSRDKMLLLSENGSIYRCEFNPDGTIFAEQIHIEDEKKVSSCHGCIQHNTFVMVDRNGYCHVWRSDIDRMFFTNLTSVPEAFFKYQATYTPILIDY